MRVLLMESDAWAADRAGRRLREAGHQTVRCLDADLDSFPCRALQPGGHCPIDCARVDVALLVRARPWPGFTPRELGAVCALRDGLPLVVLGGESAGPWGPLATVIGEEADVVAACESAAANNVRHAHHRTNLDDTVEEARRVLAADDGAGLVVFDQTTAVGVVTRRALEGASGPPPRPGARLEDMMDGEVVELAPGADVATTLRKYREAAWRSLRRRRPGSARRAARRVAAREPLDPR